MVVGVCVHACACVGVCVRIICVCVLFYVQMYADTTTRVGV